MSKYTDEAIALIHNRPGFAREVARQIGFTHVDDVKREPVLRGFGLTDRQRQLLNFIEMYLNDHDGAAPSFDEMRQALGLASKSGIHRLINALEERGHIFRISGRARCIITREATIQ